MFEVLFAYPKVLARHQAGPAAVERDRYLEHCASQGVARETLLRTARELLVITQRPCLAGNHEYLCRGRLRDQSQSVGAMRHARCRKGLTALAGPARADGLPSHSIAVLLCGVQKLRPVAPQGLPSSTPHNYRRHITHIGLTRYAGVL